jgi:hypothetical protein
MDAARHFIFTNPGPSSTPHQQVRLTPTRIQIVTIVVQFGDI